MIDQLIAEVRHAFDSNPPEIVGPVWTTPFQGILQEITLCKGDNTYK